MRLQKTSSKPANLFREVCFHSDTLSPSSASLFSPVFEPSCSRTGGEISRSLPVAAAALILNRCRPPASTGLDASVSLFARGQANYALGPSEETRYRRVQGRVRVLDSNGNWQRSLPREISRFNFDTICPADHKQPSSKQQEALHYRNGSATTRSLSPPSPSVRVRRRR